MRLRTASGSILAAAAVAVALAGCSSGSSLMNQRTQGYEIPDSAMQQIRPGQSQALVTTVLGSPQSTNSFGDQSAYYYVETKVQQTSFGMTTSLQRTVLAIYFDSSDRVVDTAVYTAEDGRTITVEGRRTPSFGEDRSFIDQILQSI